MVLSGDVAANSEEAVQSAYRYTFLHYGFHAWAIYVLTGLSLAYYAYTREMPLTIRSALTPLLGRAANGFLGHVVDVLGVVATILGVSVTIGFGVSQFVDGVYAVSGMEWLMNGEEAPKPSTVGLIAALFVIMGLSILSAVSGVGRFQTEGQKPVEIKAGDTIWIPPGERHWHGAAPDTAMCHIAFQEALDGSCWPRRIETPPSATPTFLRQLHSLCFVRHYSCSCC